MPYKKLSDLPESIRYTLPEFAQDVYLEAFKSALRQYSIQQHGDTPPEEAADQVAWSAVRQEYRRDETSGRWKRGWRL